MTMTVKHSLKYILIIFLIIPLTDCATYQGSCPPASTKKDEWFARD